MAQRFSEVMWLIEQIMWKSMDRRLADFLLSESALEGGDSLRLTHERIANHMGTAREVVTRMLRYFQSEGVVELTRGEIRLTDRKKLGMIAG
jgi:CRP/FNR family transcriptional regulator